MAKEQSRCNSEEFENPKCIKNLRWYFMEYCNNTSIHGFKYLGERRSRIEKLFWMVILTISFYYCVVMILQAYEKWERSPVIVSFATSETPIWEIPFPAVTICPCTKAIKSKFNFTKMALLINNNTDLDDDMLAKAEQFEYMSLVCSSKLDLFIDDEANYTTNPKAIDFLFKVQPEFNETVNDFSWTGTTPNDVHGMFKPIITSDGVCYSFNMLDRDEIFTNEMSKDYYNTFSVTHEAPSQWSVEGGYDKNAPLNAFPRRTLVSGVDGGIDLILLTLDSDLDYVCGDALQGYKIILHHPAMLPNPKEGFFRVGLDQDVAVAVNPNMMTTSGELKGYKPQDRNCYLNTERKLKFFQTYNQQECLSECLANFTFKLCGCVGFYMPRDNLTAICGPARMKCIVHAKASYLAKEVSFKIEHPEHKTPRNISEQSLHQDCNCLASCDSLSFDAEVSLSVWDWQKGRKIVSPRNESESYHLSRMRIFFKNNQFITSHRNELYGPTDFLANCGGLLGLFTGFSFISLVEIVYFATLRFGCNFRKHGKHQWAGAIELMKRPED